MLKDEEINFDLKCLSIVVVVILIFIIKFIVSQNVISFENLSVIISNCIYFKIFIVQLYNLLNINKYIYFELDNVCQY